ncbi:hypothetical protein [Rhizobium laguerreae]|uniref:hypothetical protein n=1 Tax=Rhizobium laguerreae TaxID=1076926 RepID=UPI001C9119A1|nr:hypothetical protein [Rhizobium laguerreae]MBY3053789.1 hypothetical protein [Rhizobium laguerreae]
MGDINKSRPSCTPLSFAAFEFVDFSLPTGFDDIGEIDSLNEVNLRNGCLDDAALKCPEPFDVNRGGVPEAPALEKVEPI